MNNSRRQEEETKSTAVDLSSIGVMGNQMRGNQQKLNREQLQ